MKISRRQFLHVSTLATAGVLAAACAKTAEPTSPPKEEPTSSAQTQQATATPVPVAESPAKEAPKWVQMVQAGDLPPLEERLPDTPMVVPLVERIGTYGGTWRNAVVGKGQSGQWVHSIGYEQIMRWTPKWDGVMPNLAESVEVNEEGTEYTFRFRKGIKHSDGVPFSADDIMFWYNDVLMNKELTPNVPSTFRRGADPVQIEQLDDFTTKWTFTKPHGLFLKLICQSLTDESWRHPKHYMSQFHADYNPEIESLVKESGQASWADLYDLKRIDFQDSAIPVLKGWQLQNALGEGVRIVSERNPYYWKTDPEGNQLPYIDRNVCDYFTETEALVLKAMNGEIDWQERFLSAPENKSVYLQNQEKGDYRVVDIIPTMTNVLNLQFNRFTTDEVLAEIFANKDFRIGMSHALDRQEIIDIVYVGQGEPHQSAPRPDSRFYHERLSKQYTEYDVDLANEYLDKAGLTERDAQGFRLRPDGKRLSVIWEVDVDETTYPDVLEVATPMWEKAGVETIIKTMERSLWEQRCRSNNLEFHASCHRYGGGSGEAVILDPRYYFPNGGGNCMYAKAWGWWYTDPDGEQAVEPPEQVREAMGYYRELEETPDTDRQDELYWKILDIAVDQFYCLGIAPEAPGYAIVTNRMKNTPPTIHQSWIYPTPAPYNPCQWFIEEA